MRRTLLLPLVAVAAAGAGVGGTLAVGAVTDRDPRDQVVELAAGQRLVLEDGVTRRRAAALASAAVSRVPGTPISVSADDGGYEVEVSRRDGSIAEVRLDDRSRVVGVDPGDG